METLRSSQASASPHTRMPLSTASRVLICTSAGAQKPAGGPTHASASARIASPRAGAAMPPSAHTALFPQTVRPSNRPAGSRFRRGFAARLGKRQAPARRRRPGFDSSRHRFPGRTRAPPPAKSAQARLKEVMRTADVPPFAMAAAPPRRCAHRLGRSDAHRDVPLSKPWPSALPGAARGDRRVY